MLFYFFVCLEFSLLQSCEKQKDSVTFHDADSQERMRMNGLKILYFSVSCPHPNSYRPHLPTLVPCLDPDSTPYTPMPLISYPAWTQSDFFFLILPSPTKNPQVLPTIFRGNWPLLHSLGLLIHHLPSLGPGLSAVSDLCFLAHSSLHLWLLPLTGMLFPLFTYFVYNHSSTIKSLWDPFLVDLLRVKPQYGLLGQ